MLDTRLRGKKISFNAEQQNIPDALCAIATKITSTGKTRNMKSNPNASFFGRRHRHIATWMPKLIKNNKKPVIRIEKDIENYSPQRRKEKRETNNSNFNEKDNSSPQRAQRT